MNEYLCAQTKLSIRLHIQLFEHLLKLEQKNKAVQHIQISCSRFGSSGPVRRQLYCFEYDMYRNWCGEQLLVIQVLRPTEL